MYEKEHNKKFMLRYEVNEIGKERIESILKKYMVYRDDVPYCKYCGNKINIKDDAFSYNHGYHTRKTIIYNCNCEKFKKIFIGETD